ncbi:MAG TPA: hypothetical protein VN514_03790, partial [Ignavibacteria bacterium]|nr:hypothetical protein [Ignavibacteria bacterium]
IMPTRSIKRIFIAFLFLFSTCSLTFFSIESLQTRPYDAQDDINNKYTNVGNIQMTVTNYGTIGKGYCGTQPSCMYPAGSGIENLWLGGLWVGGLKNGQIHVTTGAVDVSNANKVEGFEFTNARGSIITEKSSLITSAFYDPTAVSHQDFVCEFSDTSITGMIEHIPMGIKVLLESYTYNLNFANSFVILNYKIINVGYNGDTSPIDSIYVGLWKDCVVRNLNITNGCNPGTSFFSKGCTGFLDSMRMEYTYDNNGDPGFTDNYVGVKLLGVSPKASAENLRSRFTIWNYKGTDPIYFMPTTDPQRYDKLKGFLAPGVAIDTNRINYLRLNPSNRVSLISYGPYKKTDGSSFSLRYQIDTLNAVFTVVCAKKNGTDPAKFDTEFQKQNLYKNAGWAQRSYDNGYKLPSPPDIPITRAEIDDQKVTLWWSNNAENSIDPISGKKDFEGYRIFRTNAGADLTSSLDLMTALKVVGDFDSCCNGYFNNTGFKFIKYSETSPKTFSGDTNKYWYRFEFPNQLNGFQYIYTVTSYDKGDPSQGLESLESSELANVKRIIVGTTAKDNSDAEVGVYPNPYYGSAVWDGTGVSKEVLRKIYFYNLPSKCDISIWTLSGDLVIKMYHDAATYSGNDIKWFKTYSDGTQKFAGGEHAWDLITKDNQAVATGLYFFTVKDASSGEIKKG